MYVRGYFKLHNLPTALSGSILLGIAFAAGVLHTAVTNEYRRTKFVLSPLSAATAEGRSDVDDRWVGPALSAAYILNCLQIATAIFHAGVFPLYRYSSQTRYWHKLQDALATFGWSFLSLHHVSNAVILALLLGGIPLTARLAPALLLLPTFHFMLRLLPWLTPSWHYKLGLQVDLATHLPLAALYAWRAYVLGAPWELMGTAAELLHLASVAPEAWLHRNEPYKDAVPTASWDDPWGSPSGEVVAHRVQDVSEATSGGRAAGGHPPRSAREPAREPARGSPQPTTSVDTIGARVAARHRHQPGAMQSPSLSSEPQSRQLPHSGVSARTTEHATARTSAHLHPAGAPEAATAVEAEHRTDATPAGSVHTATPARHPGVLRTLFSVAEPPTDEPEQETEQGQDFQAPDGHATKPAGKAQALGQRVERLLKPVLGQRAGAHKLPVYQLLILINMASFFCYGGLVALTSAPALPRVQQATDAVLQAALSTVEEGRTKVVQGSANVVHSATQVPSAVVHGVEDAARFAYKVGHTTQQVSHALGSVQHKVQQEAVRLSIQGAQKAAEALIKARQSLHQHHQGDDGGAGGGGHSQTGEATE